MQPNPWTLLTILGDTHADPGVLARKRARRLSRLLEHAYRRVPYYRRLFEQAGITPADVRGPDDLHRIPITSKAAIQPLPLHERIPVGVNPDTLLDFTTSGTTGRPLRIRPSRADAAVNRALFLRILKQYGMLPWHRKMSVTAAAQTPTDRNWHARLGLFRRSWLSACATPEEWIARLREVRPHYLFGYGLTLRLMARALHEQQITDVRPRCVLSTSGVLDGATRREIGEGFACPVRDVYASWEGGMMAWECPVCRMYHVNADWVIVEVLKDGQPVATGEQGEVVITNLHSLGMPFIRYRQGDVAAPAEPAATCRCRLPALQAVLGRTADLVRRPSGEVMSPHPLFHLMDRTPGVARWRLTQTALQCFRVEVVPSPAFGAATEQAIRDGLSRLMGGAITVEFVSSSDLSVAADTKFRPIRSQIMRPDAPVSAAPANPEGPS